MKPFTTIACLLLALIALMQLLRVLLGWEVIVNGYAVPAWASVIATVVAGSLSLLTWRETRR